MKNTPLLTQIDIFITILNINPNIEHILNSNPFPNNKQWYLGAGCLCQTIWNFLSGYKITQGINDYDLVYYDKDIRKRSERSVQKRLKNKYKNLDVSLDVTNEARVHVWFEKDFGKKIKQHKSCDDAINTWPTTATAVGINKTSGKTNVYAPYGLNDLFSMIVRPNKPHVLKYVYKKKVKKWIKSWPDLKIISWSSI